MPSCGRKSSYKNNVCIYLSISVSASVRDGWRSPLDCLQSRQFWCVEFAQKHTDQTWWRLHLCCPHPPSLTLTVPLAELHLSTVSVESCGQTVAWEASEPDWRSSPEFWTGRKNKKINLYHPHVYMFTEKNNLAFALALKTKCSCKD